MHLENSQLLGQSHSLNISAKLIASIKVLQYSSEEIEQAILRETQENPALEVDEITQCAHCGASLSRGICPACDMRRLSDLLDGRSEVASWDEAGEFGGASALTADDGEYNPFDFVRSEETLQEHLLRQVSALVASEDHDVVEYLIGNLDSHGYLTVTVEEVAATLRAPEEQVERALAALQSLDPPGIGARNLSECLALQLGVFEERGADTTLLRRLVSDHLRALAERRFSEIAREVGATSGEVKNAWYFIRSNFNPYPAHGFESGDAPGVRLSTAAGRRAAVRPDVIFRRAEIGFDAEIVERRRYRFGVHPVYADLYARTRRSHTCAEIVDAAGKQHVRDHVARTRFFVDCMRQRWETLMTIANALIELQSEFLDKGVRFLRPLTRGELADHVGLHESTVSRATANKFVLLPDGRTVSFDDFFDSSLAAKDVLKELIDAEHPGKPLSDEDLAELMGARGITLARRTVAKYREAMGILPSRLRF